MLDTPITVKVASRKPPCRTRLKEELKRDRDRARDRTLQALRGGHNASPGGFHGAEEEEEPRPSDSREVDARLNRVSEQFDLDLSDPAVREDLLALEEEIWEELQVAYYRQLEELDDPCAYFEHLTQQ